MATLYREPPSNGPNWLGKDMVSLSTPLPLYSILDLDSDADLAPPLFQPYPSNPSFRPPPPLSNDLKDLIYSEVYTGGSSSSAILSTLESLSSTNKSSNSSSSSSSNASSELQKRINRVSEEFGISKKRVEAVLKLKEHERGMKERGEVSIPSLFVFVVDRGLFPFPPSAPPRAPPAIALPRRSHSSIDL